MLVSCLMPTFNRWPRDAALLDEAVESFLRQDHPAKELLVCNDAPGQILRCDAPGVVVLNRSERFATLSDKLAWMIDRARGDALCRWDDDDVSLPWRLSLSVARLGERLEWRPESHWYAPGNRIAARTVRPGNSHAAAIWRREVLDRIGGYPPGRVGDEDQAFNRALCDAGVGCEGEELRPAEDFYLYRWGVSSQHLSGLGGDCRVMWERIGAAPVAPGEYVVRPRWRRNYVADAAAAVRRLA